MKPLSAILYLRSNFKSALPVFISITVGVFLVYFYTLFSATSIKAENVVSFDLIKKYNIVYTTNESKSLPVHFFERLKEANCDGVMAVQMNTSGLAYYRGGMGGTTTLTFNLFDDDVQKILDNFGVHLVAGHLPSNNQNEILVPQEYILQSHLSVGDFIGNQVSELYSLQGKYKICGITKGPVLFNIVCQPGKETKEQIMKRGVIYPVAHLNTSEQNRLVDDLPAYVSYRTYDSYKQALGTTLKGMQSLTYILTVVMIIILCIALGNLNAILFANRREEFYILNAIGYTKVNMSMKLWKENVFMCLAGYITGIGLTELVVWLLNNNILYSQGKVLEIMDLSGIIAALAIPIFVSFFSLLPCLLNNFSKNTGVIV